DNHLSDRLTREIVHRAREGQIGGIAEADFHWALGGGSTKFFEGREPLRLRLDFRHERREINPRADKKDQITLYAMFDLPSESAIQLKPVAEDPQRVMGTDAAR